MVVTFAKLALTGSRQNDPIIRCSHVSTPGDSSWSFHIRDEPRAEDLIWPLPP